MASIDLRLGTRVTGATQAAQDQKLRILILGPFSGSQDQPQAANLPPLIGRRIDRDNIDDVLQSMGVVLSVELLSGQRVNLRPQQIDDFHPDRLLALTELRVEPQQEPATAAGAAPEAQPSLPSQSAQPQADASGLLDQVLASTSATEASAGAEEGWDQALRKMLEPHLPAEPAAPRELTPDATDQLSRKLAMLLHHPEFQSMESCWRGVQWLVQRLEDDRQVECTIADLPIEQLHASFAAESGDPLSIDQLIQSRVGKLLQSGAAAAKPWNLIIGLYTCDAEPRDIQTVTQLGLLAQHIGAPVVVTAAGRVVGCEDPQATPDPDDWQPLSSAQQEIWNQLRDSPGASFIGLVWPRWMLRLPYGPQTSTIETFDFDECSGSWHASDYLWGHGGLIFAELAARNFVRSGGHTQSGAITEVHGLPLHLYNDDDGQRQAHPCGEVAVTERGARKIAAQGIMPLLSIRGAAAVCLPSTRSLARDSR